MKQRCMNPNDKQYHLYGGRGISVCDEWERSFEAFRAYVGKKPDKNSSLDRIDNDRGYEPGNVRWATGSEQLSNTRRNVRIVYEGKSQTLMEWSVELGIPYNTLRQRKLNGWSDSEIISRPVDKSFARNHKRLAMSSADSL